MWTIIIIQIMIFLFKPSLTVLLHPLQANLTLIIVVVKLTDNIAKLRYLEFNRFVKYSSK